MVPAGCRHVIRLVFDEFDWRMGIAMTAQDRRAAKLAFIGFGEAASAFLSGWRGAGLAQTVAAFDIKTDSSDKAVSARKWADYAAAGVTGAERVEDALAGATLVFSLVTADAAHAAACNAAPHLAPGALFFDGNSCAPGTKRASARVVEAAGGRYVDLAVMAPVHPKLHKTPLLVAGPHAADALAALAGQEMSANDVTGEVGAASSIKMIRSVMMKGLEALFLECVLAGRRAGVDEVVLDSLDVTFPGFGFKDRAAYMQERVISHGIRRAAEMREVARTVDELGLSGAMSRAAVEWQQRVGDLKLDPHAIGESDYRILADAILARLDPQGH